LAATLGLVPVQALLGATVVRLELPDRLVGVHFMIGMVRLALTAFACVASWRGSEQHGQSVFASCRSEGGRTAPGQRVVTATGDAPPPGSAGVSDDPCGPGPG
jgi:heme A synthase